MSDIKRYKMRYGGEIYQDYYLCSDVDPIITERDQLKMENERLRQVIDKVYSDLQAKSKGANIQQISIIEYLGKAIEAEQALKEEK